MSVDNSTEDNNVVEINKIRDKKLMIILRTIIIGLIVILLLFMGFVTYLQFVVFEEFQTGIPLAEYVEEIKDDLSYEEAGILVEIPEEIISYEIMPMIVAYIEQEENPLYKLESLYYDGQTQSFRMNLIRSGFYLPISIKVNYMVVEGQLNISYGELTIGRNGLNPIGFVKSWMNNIDAVKFMETLTFKPVDYGMDEGYYLDTIKVNGNQLELGIKVKEAVIIELINDMKKSVDNGLLERYKNSNQSEQLEVVAILTQIYPLSKEQIIRIISDLRSEQILIRHLLILLNEDMLASSIETFKLFGVEIDGKQIALDRKALEGQIIDDYAIVIFEALDNYFGDRQVPVNLGKPFDLDKMKTITIKRLVELNNIEIEEEILERMTFIRENGFSIAYEVDPTSYYIKSVNDYRVITEEAYRKIEGSSDYVEATYVDDVELWQGVETVLKSYFNVDKVYVRYMKSDGTSVFVVASPEDDPQDYWSFALYKESEFVILEENVKIISNLLQSHPEFNIETATKEVETINLKRIASDIHTLILEEMYALGKLSHPSNYTIDFSSYDGSKYISFLISNGSEYVYRVEGTSFGTYLATVYSKDKAIRNWDDLSELIILQDIPK